MTTDLSLRIHRHRRNLDIPSPAAVYAERCDRFAAERDAISARWNLIANLRLVVAIAAVPCLIWGIAGVNVVWWARLVLLTGLALLGLFVVLAVYHGRLGRVRRRADELWAVNDEALTRLARDWDRLPLRHEDAAPPGHAYAGDLDIIGRASLLHLIEGVTTPYGDATLRSWLLNPADAETARERQAGVAELAPLLDLRDELSRQIRRMEEVKPDPEPFLTWAESDHRLIARRPWLPWAARFSVALLWALLFVDIFDIYSAPLWLAPIAINFVLVQFGVRDAHPIIGWVWSQERAFAPYAASFELLEAAPLHTGALTRLQGDLRANGLAAHVQMRRLRRIARFSIPMSSQLYWPIQIMTLWDVHVIDALERWQAVAGRSTRRWLTALGEAEALAALAALACDNPAWTFPEIDREAHTLSAHDLGHPLIPPDVRVDNDVEVGPPGSVLLVTGSNMSGKSTLLRAIGVNVVLANAGGPVCATGFRAPPLRLWTSMRVQDSLAQGVSYFMAELQRLKAVVDAARAHAAGPDHTFLYLLDEILQGTNTAERQIAARRIIAELVRLGAIGAVSTHDLTLAEGGELAEIAHPIHFTETVSRDADGPAMSFDYRIHPGIARSTNALKLMEIVGLDLQT